jgi:hypothetical protein
MGLYNRYDLYRLKNQANKKRQGERQERPRVLKAAVSLREYLESKYKR